MSGSTLAAVIIPLVVMPSLAAWLIMVFHAARHPLWGNSQASRPATPEPAAPRTAVPAARPQAVPGPAPARRAA